MTAIPMFMELFGSKYAERYSAQQDRFQGNNSCATRDGESELSDWQILHKNIPIKAEGTMDQQSHHGVAGGSGGLKILEKEDAANLKFKRLSCGHFIDTRAYEKQMSRSGCIVCPECSNKQLESVQVGRFE